MRIAEQLRYLVLAAQLEGRRRWAGALRPLGLTPSQAEVLRVLNDYGSMSMTTLGSLLVCETGTNPSRLVDRLVARELVHRRPDPDDARAVVLSLTAEGLEQAHAVSELEQTMYAQLDGFAGPDAEATVRFLRAYVTGTPVGESFARRESGPDGVTAGGSRTPSP